MSFRELESLYDYDYEDQDDEEPFIYSPNNAYKNYEDDQMTTRTGGDTIPHQLEDTVYEIAPEKVPFYAHTTNKQEYTWKVPNPRERRSYTPVEAEKVPFYSETTNRSQYVPIDMTVQRTRLSRRTSNLPATNVPLETQTTYRNLFQELEIGKRQKLIHTCPAEKLVHQAGLLRKSRRENGHFFLTCQASTTVLQPTPLLAKPAGNESDTK